MPTNLTWVSWVAGFPRLVSFAGSSLLGTAGGVLLHVLTSEKAAGGQAESLKNSVENVAKELWSRIQVFKFSTNLYSQCLFW